MKTLKSNRLHIAVFGKTNAGKSSFVNRVTNQSISIVSEIAGTTTDVVEKSMELLPIGSVRFLDTAGLDDTTSLSEERINATLKVINRTDIAVIICDAGGLDEVEKDLIQRLKTLNIPFLIVINKSDISTISEEKFSEILALVDQNPDKILKTSVTDDENLVFSFKSALLKLLPDDFVTPPTILGDLIPPKSTVVLVIPIDKEAPKGRIILPQVQSIRDLLDNDCLSLVVKESELEQALASLKTPPALVVTDSQAFKQVSEIVPENIPLTSFSILFARLKGDLEVFVHAAKAIDTLQDGDKILILESCTHHPIEDDIGRVKIPRLLRQKTNKNLIIEHASGHDFPDITPYKLIIHCGACMTTRREVLSRIMHANNLNIPITNYGITISHCLGILERAVKIFG